MCSWPETSSQRDLGEIKGSASKRPLTRHERRPAAREHQADRPGMIGEYVGRSYDEVKRRPRAWTGTSAES
jgi:hypothetical protein